MPNLPNGSKGDSNPGSLDCESGILPLCYCAQSHGPSFTQLKTGYIEFAMAGN